MLASVSFGDRIILFFFLLSSTYKIIYNGNAILYWKPFILKVVYEKCAMKKKKNNNLLLI